MIDSFTIEQTIKSFETARASGVHRIGDFLPDSTDAGFTELRDELIRVDMEISFSAGFPRRVDDYLAEFPELQQQPTSLNAIAFEEFRQRRENGDEVSPCDYRERFGCDTTHWPTPNGDGSLEVEENRSIFVEELSQIDVNAGSRYRTRFKRFPEVGQLFRHYRLLELIGEGTFGRVFIAADSSLSNRVVALKISVESASESDRLARLQHTNIVPIYSVHREGELHGICMPFLGRTTLASLAQSLRANGIPAAGSNLFTTVRGQFDSTIADEQSSGQPKGLDVDDTTNRQNAFPDELDSLDYIHSVYWLMSRVAAGLGHAHERGILHRDLKPANVLVADDGQPLILDFNLAVELDKSGSAIRSRVGGTIPYMSPEHLEYLADTGTEEPDQRSDIFSIGVILYELLTGDLPFESTRNTTAPALTQLAASRRVQLERTPRVNQLPASTQAILRRCLAPAPQDRYQSAAELQEDLLCQLEERPLRNNVNNPLERSVKWVRRNRWFTSFAFVVTVLTLMMGVVTAGYAYRGRKLQQLQFVDSVRQFDRLAEQLQLELAIDSRDVELLWQVTQSASKRLEEFPAFMDGSAFRSPYFPHADLVYSRRNATRVLFQLSQLEHRINAIAHRPELLELSRRHIDSAISIAGGLPSLLDHKQQISKSKDVKLDAGEEEILIPEDPLVLGLKEFNNRDYSRAMVLFRKAVRESPMDGVIWYVIGQCHLGLSQPAKAEAAFDVCIAQQLHSESARFQRGIARMQQQRWEEAREDFFDLKNGAYATLSSLNDAICLQRLGKAAQAIEVLKSEPLQREKRARTFFLLANLRRSINSDSEPDIEKCLALIPRDEVGWLTRGTILLKRKEFDSAMQSFDKALSLNPRYKSALNNKAHLLAEKLGRLPDAIDVLDKMVVFFPDDLVVQSTRGVLHARAGNVGKAMNDVKHVLSKRKTEVAAVYRCVCAVALVSPQNKGAEGMAIRLLGNVLKQKPSLALTAMADPDLANLRDTDDYKSLIKAALTVNQLAKLLWQIIRLNSIRCR